jgi:hypothetical protein
MKTPSDYPIAIQQQIHRMGWIPFTEWDELVCDRAFILGIDIVDAAISLIQEYNAIRDDLCNRSWQA